jgi:hypothetical protein
MGDNRSCQVNYAQERILWYQETPTHALSTRRDQKGSAAASLRGKLSASLFPACSLYTILDWGTYAV